MIDSEPDDATLVQAVLAGDTEAFGNLYDRYGGIVRAICFEATGNVNDSQDLTQDIFLNAYRQLSSLKDANKFGSWLVGIGRFSSRHWRRTRARDRHCFVEDPSEIEEVAAVEQSLPRNSLDELQLAMFQLTESERMALHLFYLESQPAEVARRLLDVSLSGFYRMLDRARSKLCRLMCENESEQQ